MTVDRRRVGKVRGQGKGRLRDKVVDDRPEVGHLDRHAHFHVTCDEVLADLLRVYVDGLP